MNSTTLVGLAVVLVIVAGLLYALFSIENREDNFSITNFEECVAAGNAVMESYPRQCRSEDGRLFVEDVGVQVPNPPQGNIVGEGCAIAGCSGQLCVSADEAGDIFTTCEYRAEYACYENARCEKQASGQCGWTETEELRQCLANPPSLGDASEEPQAL